MISHAARDRGVSAVEYGGILLLAGAVLAAMVALGVPNMVGTRVGAAVCAIFGSSCPAGSPGQMAGPVQPGQRRSPSSQRRPPSQQPSTQYPQETAQIARAQRETEAVLGETPRGRAALSWLRKHRVRVIYGPGHTFYKDATNSISVDMITSAEDRAVSIVHEVYHAQHRYSPNATSLTRPRFVNASMAEETEGAVRKIKANQQLQAARARSGKEVPPDTTLQSQYMESYNDAVQRARAARAQAGLPPLTQAQERAKGEKAGRDRVLLELTSGEHARPSNDSDKTYPQYYGDYWDQVHAQQHPAQGRRR